MENVFSDDYLYARACYLEDQLSKFPRITMGKHRGEDVICAYNFINGQMTRNRHRLSSQMGKKLSHDYKLKKELDEKLNSLVAQYGFLKTKKHVKLKQVKLLPYSIKDKLIPDSNPREKKGNYWYKGIQMRSRLEIVVAQIIDSLGLEFMYEVSITINGNTYSPDFIVFLPELGCCFIIECLGMTDDINYLVRNSGKLIDYINIGLHPNENFLLFCGTKDSIPDPSVMKADIVHIINNLTAKIVVK